MLGVGPYWVTCTQAWVATCEPEVALKAHTMLKFVPDVMAEDVKRSCGPDVPESDEKVPSWTRADAGDAHHDEGRSDSKGLNSATSRHSETQMMAARDV